MKSIRPFFLKFKNFSLKTGLSDTFTISLLKSINYPLWGRVKRIILYLLQNDMAQKQQDWSAFPELQILCFCCLYEVAPEQKARTTYDNILRLVKDPEVCEPIRFLREREIVHYQRFGESLRIVQDHLDSKNFYAINPEFDIRPRD